MKGIFITGTDTGVGKTVVTGLLARHLLTQGHSVVTQKWVQTGASTFGRDIDVHMTFMGTKQKDRALDRHHRNPYVFNLAASPHLAASQAKTKIKKQVIKRSFRLLSKKFDYVLVEGAGGALVPLNHKTTLLDIAGELKLPILIVAENKLGVINHALLTVEALRKRDIEILGIVFNASGRKLQRLVRDDNPKIVARLTKEVVLGNLARERNKERLYRAFVPIGDKILKHLPPK